LIAGSLVAARAEERPITLAEALALAAKANPELQAAALRADAQLARAEAVERARWPRATVESAWSRTDLPAAVFARKLNSGAFTAADFDPSRLNDPSALSHLGTSAVLELPIDVFGKIGSGASALAAQGSAAAAGTRDAALEVRFRVVEAYRQAEVAGRAVDVTRKALEVATARTAEMEARVEAGSALVADLLRARTRRREREADVAERRGQQQMAQARLSRLLGAPAGVGYAPIEAPPAVAALAGEEADWTARALRQRPVLEAARRRQDAAAAVARTEKNGLLPDVGGYALVSDDRISGGSSQAWAVGLGVRWTPFDAGRGKREAAAVSEQRAAEQDARAATDEVRLEVSLAYRRAVAARERHTAASGGAEEGREALRVVQERRKAGMATLTDELETEAAALGAALAELTAAADVAVADAALARAAGEI
jgi:outer membrane protein